MMETEIIELNKLAERRTARAAFGEFLVTARVLDRFQLFRALQMQDRMPGARIGQCAVALGYVARAQIEHMHAAFEEVVEDAEMELMPTESFDQIEQVEIDILVEP